MGGDRIGSVERLRFLSAVSLSQRFIPLEDIARCVIGDARHDADHVRFQMHRIRRFDGAAILMASSLYMSALPPGRCTGAKKSILRALSKLR